MERSVMANIMEKVSITLEHTISCTEETSKKANSTDKALFLTSLLMKMYTKVAGNTVWSKDQETIFTVKVNTIMDNGRITKNQEQVFSHLRVIHIMVSGWEIE